MVNPQVKVFVWGTPNLTHAKGQALRKWLSDSKDGCPIPKVILTLADLSLPAWTVAHLALPLAAEYQPWIRHLILPIEEYGGVNPNSVYQSFTIVKYEGPRTSWFGQTGPGVIYIEDVHHTQNSSGLQISKITKAVYENDFPLSTLWHIFVANIVNADTNLAATRVLESHERLGSLNTRPVGWKAPSAESRSLLGSRIGKLVSYFFLGAYGQGVKQVTRITTFHCSDYRRDLNIQFDIEDA